MIALGGISASLADHWHIWLVSTVLVAAAVIDGCLLKVPNWLTFPFILAGWIHGFATGGWEGLGASLWGTAIGLALLLPLYVIGGMGAGDVKLLAGVGAWIGFADTLGAFFWSAIAGALIAVIMVLVRRAWSKHLAQFFAILNEILTIRSPSRLAAISAERKSSMLLLPYGIPIAIGSIAYFTFSGMLP